MRSTRTDDPTRPEPPPAVMAGRYELGRLLGTGGMSRVYQARDLVLDRDVALKVFGAGLEPAAEDPKRQQAEMRTLASLTHPNLVVVHDAGTDTPGNGSGPRTFLVMELIDGPSLAECLRAGPLPADRVGTIGAGVAAALQAVHAAGVVHRDVKPGNILLDQIGRARLTDFGIAQTLDGDARTATGLTLGTAAYLSPEQVEGRAVGPASDIYSLGLVLLEALTGRREYPGVTAETALARLSRSPSIDPALPGPWPQLLTTMTANDPARRPDAAAVAAALRSAEDSTTVLPSPYPEAEPRPPRPAAAAPPDVTRLLTTAVPAAGRLDERSDLAARPAPRRQPRTLAWSPRLVLVAALAASVLLVVLVATMSRGGSGGTTPTVSPAPSGAPGPARLGPDVDRLRQLVTR